MYEDFDLTDHVAFLTGANSGVGLGMARGLVKAGASVVISGTNPTKNTDALEHLRTFSPKVEVLRVDVGEEQQVVGAIKEVVERFGRLDSCFANAAVTGGYHNPPFVDSTLDSWQALMRVNLDGTYLTLREAARQMIAQGDGGSLVATSSVAARFGSPREEAYAASKAGIEALVRSLAVGLGKHNIRANALQPAWTESPQTDAWKSQEEVARKILARVPLRRFGQPSEWEGIAVYLASKASSWHTGDVLRLDGGFGIF